MLRAGVLDDDQSLYGTLCTGDTEKSQEALQVGIAFVGICEGWEGESCTETFVTYKWRNEYPFR